MEALSAFTELQVIGAVEMAIAQCKFFPSIAELLEFVHVSTLNRHRLHAQQMNERLLDRGAKPDDWNFKLEDAWRDLDTRAELQFQRDLAFHEKYTDDDWPSNRTGHVPEDETYVAYLRRKEARERHAKGLGPIKPSERYRRMAESMIPKPQGAR